jgi:cytidyltransferase-like protein
MKILAVYPGRFQPFHKGHAQVFQWLKNKFGDAVIATSDKVEAPKSPFNFAEKKRMMKLAGVPAGKIKQVTNPYIAREILENYDPKTTVLVFAVSQKDMEEDPRFSFKPTRSGKPGYLQPYKGNEKKLKPFGDTQSPKGYVVVTPTFTFDVLGKPATSASELRKQFVSLDNKKQKEFIKDLFGKYDESVHKLMKDKIGAMVKKPKIVKQLREGFNIGLTFARKEMPQIGAASSFMKYLRDNDIESKRTKVDPNEFRSSQIEYDRDKVESLKMNPSKNPIIVSNDGYIMDGHHRWLADQEESRKTDAIVCDLPILDLIYHAKNHSQQTLKEEVTRKELAPMLDSFVSFASDKLGLKSMPTVKYKTNDDNYNSFAAYNPSSNELSICTMNRHPMDIFRSVAHELVHHKQNEDGRLGKDIAKEGETGSDIENEANAEAGKIMRWFAKSNPDMFGQSYVVENNTAALAPVGGIRGLGNVTGEVSPTTTSNYVTSNQHYTQTMKSNHTAGLWFDDGTKKPWLDQKGKIDYHKRTEKSFKILREQLTEGINDPGKLKAIFLAGGPGSGKDYVMNATLAGEGLKEINSDVAFEYLMTKNGLDLEMPDEEKVERDIVRGRAKNITKEQERLALAGRLGLIINGTADDLEKISRIKKGLEDDGYETMMVFVNTSNDVSRERNVERGKMGKRKVPDGTDKQGVPDNSPNIRQEKWDLAQENIGELQKIFGNDRFTVIDNTADIRKVGPEEKAKVLTNFNRVRRMAQQFVRSDNRNPEAQKWIEAEAKKRGITYQEPKRYKSLTQIRQDVPKVVHKPDNDLMLQARRLGLSYYGFGRFGRKVGGVNKVMYHSKGGQLVRVQTMNEEKKMKNPCWKGYRAYGMKKKNGREVPNCVPVEEGHEVVHQTKMRKGANRPKMKIKRKLAENINADFSTFMEEHGAGDWGTPKLTLNYVNGTPGQESVKAYDFLKKKKKVLTQEDELPLKMGYGLPIVDTGLGPETTQYRQMAAIGFGAGLSVSESIMSWINNDRTQEKFITKYGELAEEKLIETALMLEEAGCGTTISEAKSIKKLKETFPSAPYKSTYGDMSPLSNQNKDDQQLNERGADSKGLYRPTEKGAGLTPRGAEKFGVQTAVTEPNPTGKRKRRRDSFCARMGGMPGPMKDEKGRPTRKAASLSRWRCRRRR